MGSTASKAAPGSAVIRKVADVSRSTKPISSDLTKKTSARQSPNVHRQVTAQLRDERSHTPHPRKTPEEWAQTLNRISGAISSSTWEGEVMAAKMRDSGEHPARRSEKTVGMLPSRAAEVKGSKARARAEGQEEEDETIVGRLSQNQVIVLYNLRRRDPKEWSAAKIAERFKVSEGEVEHLLMFTRTYTGETAADGHVAGFYKKIEDDIIVRFERD